MSVLVSRPQRWYQPSAALSPSGGGAFTPLSLTGLKAWYKADGTLLNSSASAPANNDQLSQWNDSSGNNYHLTGNFGASASGAYLSAGLNGKKTVYFSGPGDVEMDVSSVAFGGSNTAFFYGYVSALSTGNIFRRWGGYVSAGDANVDGTHSCCWQATHGSLGSVYGTVGGDSSTQNTISTDTGTRVGLIVDGPNSQVISIINGVKQTAGTISSFTNFVTNGSLRLGSSGPSGAGATFYISEWIVCNAVPSTSDIASVDNYLTRWN